MALQTSPLAGPTDFSYPLKSAVDAFMEPFVVKFSLYSVMPTMSASTESRNLTYLAAIFYKSAKASKIEEKDVFFERHFEDTYYRAIKLNISGVPVWFVQTHLDSNTYLAGHRKDRAEQMEKLIEDFRDKPHVVIAGDFRVGVRIPGKPCFPAPEEYKVFEDAGFELVNLFGTGTYPVESPLQPLDNILLKGVGVSEVRFIEADRLSDHLAISCKLSIYDGE